MTSTPPPDGTSANSGPASEHRRLGPERWVSLLVLCVLAVMVGTILQAQKRFNPAVEVAMGLLSTAPDQQTPASISAPLGIPLPATLVPIAPVQTFLPANLSDKINGKAELYLKAGFVRLVAQRFRVDSAPDAWIEASIYEMARPEAAFSVYSLQRRENGRHLEGLPHAYATENAVFLQQGRFYAEIVASTVSQTVAEPVQDLARRFIDANPVTDTGVPADKDLFPQTGLEMDSVRLIPSDAFGFDALDHVLVATYRFSGKEATGFLTRRSNPEEAGRLKTEYGNFLTRFGAVPAEESGTPSGAAAYDVMGFFEIIFVYDEYLAGVHEAEDHLVAEQLANDMHRRIRQVVDERSKTR